MVYNGNQVKYIYERDKCRSIGNVDQYKLLRNECLSMVKRSKQDFFNKAKMRIKRQHIYGKI